MDKIARTERRELLSRIAIDPNIAFGKPCSGYSGMDGNGVIMPLTLAENH